MNDRGSESLHEAGRARERPNGGLALGWGVGAAIVIGAVGASLLWRPRPILLWNASASSPVGLYAVTSREAPRAGDMVVAWPPRSARRLAATRFYLPFDVPLVKPVGAAAGDRVCARGDRVFVNGRAAARRRQRDPAGRQLPHWSGCVRLQRSELFLLARAGPLSFDGRYFGITRASEVVGKARLLWPRPARSSAHG